MDGHVRMKYKQLHSRPQSHDHSDLWQGSRALAGPDFLSMCRVIVSYSQPIRFARFDGNFVIRGLPLLDKARALDPCRRSEWSWLWGREWNSCSNHPLSPGSHVIIVLREQFIPSPGSPPPHPHLPPLRYQKELFDRRKSEPFIWNHIQDFCSFEMHLFMESGDKKVCVYHL